MDTILDSQSVDLQLTHKYRSHWRHLNRQHHLGSVNIIDILSPHAPDKFEGCTVIKRAVWVPREGAKVPYKTASIVRALEDSYSYGGCDHEHDCCGCESSNATVIPWPDYTGDEFHRDNDGKPTIPNTERNFMIIQSLSYNY